MSCICLGVQFTVPGTSLKGPQWYKPELSAECVCPSGALPFSWASVHWHQWESLGFLCSVFMQKQVLKTAYHKLKLLPPLWFSHLMWCPQLPKEMPLFTHSNRWSHIPAASCCAWVFFLVVCSSCRPKGLKIPSCQGAEQGRPRLLQESSALARSAAFSLQRSACVRGLLSRLLLLRQLQLQLGHIFFQPFWLQVEVHSDWKHQWGHWGLRTGLHLPFCGPCGSSVSKKDQVSSKTIRNYCSSALHSCLLPALLSSEQFAVSSWRHTFD